MQNQIMKGARIALVIFWLAVFYNLIFPLPGILYTILLYSLPIMIVGHFGEWLMVNGKLKQAGYEGVGTLVKVIIFGFAWWLPILGNKQDNSTVQRS